MSTTNVLLAAVATIAATALMATSAFAQSVEVVAEPGGVHCGDITEEAAHDVSGGCEIGVVSTSNFVTFGHSGMTELVGFTCESELLVNINEEGQGYVDVTETTIHTNPSSSCVFEECDEAESRPAGQHAELEWPIAGILEYGGEREEMILTFCLRSHMAGEGAGSTCTITPTISQNKATHVQTIIAGEEPCLEAPTSEISGTWQTVGGSEIEIVHNHYPGDYPAG